MDPAHQKRAGRRQSEPLIGQKERRAVIGPMDDLMYMVKCKVQW